MKRRDFLRLSTSAATGTALTLPFAPASGAADSWTDGFAQAEASPWTLGFRSAAGDIDPGPAQVRGQFPVALHGVLYRNGPAVHDMAGQRYHHWFDGDGMVHRFVIEGARSHHQGRYVAHAQAGGRGAGRTPPVRGLRHHPAGASSRRPRPNSINVANTSVLPMRGEVLALWEGGSAHARRCAHAGNAGG